MVASGGTGIATVPPGGDARLSTGNLTSNNHKLRTDG